MEWWSHLSAVITFIGYTIYLCFNEGLSWSLVPTIVMLVTIGLFILLKEIITEDHFNIGEFHNVNLPEFKLLLLYQ